MKIKTTLKVLALGCTATIFLGVLKHNHKKPGDLGFHRAKIGDSGLIELRIDQIRQAIRSGNPDAITEMLATNANEHLKTATSQLTKTISTKNAIAVLKDQPRPGLSLKTQQIDLEDERAVYHGQFLISGMKPENVELTFRKYGRQWKLQQANNFLSALQKTTPQSSTRLQSENAFVLFEEESQTHNTLVRTAVNAEHHIEKLTKSVTMDKLGKKLFSKPYAGVLFSSVTQLQHAPYFSARYVQLVTDPAWNRIVYGDYDGWIKAYGNDGAGKEILSRPHGIDRDTSGRIYVADTGNNRIVVLALDGRGENVALNYQFDFGAGDLSLPYDVAWDDAGTPFDTVDDIIWVADTGNNRILGFQLHETTATRIYETDETMSFFAPKAVAVGRFNGVSDQTLYVSDTGNRRIAKLHIANGQLQWAGDFNGREESQFTSIDVDHWGNVYVTDRSYREIRKLTSNLELIDTIHGEDDALLDPMNFRIIYGQVYVERDDEKIWAGYDQAFSLEKWTEHSGGERFQLAVDISSFNVTMAPTLDELAVHATLTDHSQVALAMTDAATGATIRQMPMGWLIPGEKDVVWDRRDDLGLQVEPGFYKLQLSAKSGYGQAEVLKETPAFYLPLYYREDSGGDYQHDTHLIQGTRNSDRGNAPSESIAEHPSEVIYRFEDLNPTVDYEMNANFFNKAGDYLKQRITVDDFEVISGFEIPSGQMEIDWVQLPRDSYTDGSIDIKISKIAGAGPAMISQLQLREANYDPEHPPEIQKASSSVPEAFTLLQNYPNPFNPTTTIRFDVPKNDAQKVTLKIFNMLGQTVKVLVNENLSPGQHSVVWSGRDGFGKPASSGVYFYQLKAGDFSQVKKLVLMK